MLKPLNDYVLIKIKIVEETASGLVVKGKENQQQEYGTVMADFKNDITVLEKGTTIFFKSYSAIPITVEGEEFHFVKFEEIIAVE